MFISFKRNSPRKNLDFVSCRVLMQCRKYFGADSLFVNASSSVALARERMLLTGPQKSTFVITPYKFMGL